MKLPDTIKFGFMDISVTYQDGLVKGEGSGCSISPKTQEIHIQATYPDEEKARRLFLMIHFLVGILGDENANKQKNAIVAAGMYSAIRDNPILAQEFDAAELKGKTLHVLGRDFKVTAEPEHYAYDGYTWADHWQIIYNSGCANQYAYHTMIHELYHAITLSLDLEYEDEVIDRMAFAYCLLVHQNDLSWLFHAVDEADTAKP